MSDTAAFAPTRLAWRRYVPALPAVLAVLAAGVAFQRVFTFAPLPAPLALAALIGAAGGVVIREAFESRSRPFAASYVLGFAVLAVATLASTVAAAVLADPAARSLGVAVSQGPGALVGGWSRILTTSVPVPASADRLPLAAGLVAFAAGWAVVAATRRPPRVDALAPAALVLFIGLLLGVHGPGSIAVVAGPGLVLAAAYLLLISRPAGEGVVWVPPGRVLAAIVTAAVVLAVSLAAGNGLPLATLRQPVDLRAALSPPLDLSNTPDPLDELPGWQKDRAEVMFTASVDPAWLRARPDWRLASLETYDGAGWSTDAKASRAGAIFSPPEGVSTALLGPKVRVAVHLEALPTPWVPTVGLPTGVSPADLDFDNETSILVAPSLAGGRAFDVSGRLAQPSVGALDDAGIGSGESIASLTAVPSCFPAPLRKLASQSVAGLERPDELAVAVEQELAKRGGFRIDNSATPGSSCARLATLAKTHVGTEEQYATAFALMVRSVGLPSRLVVGFTPGSVDARSRRTVVTAADVTVWPEVDLGDVGWVAFDPVPTATGQSTKTPDKVPALDPGLQQVRQSVNQHHSTPTTVPHRVPSGRGTTPAPTGLSGVAVALLAVGALLVAAAAFVVARLVVRRRRRARRRSASEPARRVLGAWAELLDSLGPFRVPVRGLTPSEVSAEAGRLVPAAGDPSRQLATIVDRAVFAEAADDGSAAQAWACSELAVRALDGALPRRLRLGAVLVGSRPSRDRDG